MFRSFAPASGLALLLGASLAVPAVIAATPTATAIKFQQAEAPVTGSFMVKEQAGKTQLVFSDDFSTNPKAPALQVVLNASTTPLKTLTAPHYPLKPGSYTLVAPLKSAKGAQTYDLPAGVDLKSSGSVLIWCKQANATMAWAPLK